MTSALDMSLDDIIKSNKRSSSRGRGGGGRGSGLGPARHTFKRSVNRTAPYSKVTIFFKKQKKKRKEKKISALLRVWNYFDSWIGCVFVDLIEKEFFLL